MSLCLVTGGAGFIGSHVVRGLLADGHDVRVLDNFRTGKRENLEEVAGSIAVFEADLRHHEEVLRACHGVDFVFHLGALPSVPLSVEEPEETNECNVTGTLNVLRAGVEQECKRVIYAASSSAYGDTEVSPKHEGLLPGPLSPYAVQKLTGEHYCRAFSACHGLETISLRYFNVFGPRQNPESQYAAAIPAFVTAILRDEPPTVYGDGEQTRDFTFVDNVVHGNLQAMRMERSAGQSVNVACGDQISVNQVIAEINKLLGKKVKPVYAEVRPGDVKHSCADISRARELLAFEPQVEFGEGLRRAIDYYQSLA